MFKPKTLILSITPILLAVSMAMSSSLVVNQEVEAKEKDTSSNQGWPTRRVSGGSRTNNATIKTLIALIPEQLVETTSTNPTLVFYISSLKKEINPLQEEIKVEFVLRDQQDKLICESNFTTDKKEELLIFSLAEVNNCPALKKAENYRWYLSIINNPLDRAHDSVVEGWFRQTTINSTLAASLEELNPLEKAKIYQEHELWYEAIATLAELKQMKPNEPTIAQQWHKLMEALGFEADFENLAGIINISQQ